MANRTAVWAKHATLSGTTVDKVTLSAKVHAVEVMNRSGSTTLTVTAALGATAGDPPDPTSLADDTNVVPPGTSVVIPLAADSTAITAEFAGAVVKVLGNGNDYSVLGA